MPEPSAEAEEAPAREGCPEHVELPEEIHPSVCSTPDEDELVAVSARWQTLVPETDDCSGACPVPTSGVGFTSPGGNLGCLSGGAGEQALSCAAGNTAFAEGSVWFEFGVLDARSAGGAPRPEALQMIGSEGFDVDATRLEFTEVARTGPTSYCAMQYFGVTCWDTERDEGFLVSRDQWIAWNAKDVRSEGSCETCGKYRSDGTPI